MATKKNVIIGIDPGAKGYLCLLDPVDSRTAFHSTSLLPMDIFNLIKKIENEFNLLVIMIENVHSLPKVSAKSNFNFGYNVGAINAITQATGNRVDKVTPKIWQKSIGVKSTTRGKDIKKEVATICEQLYPNAVIRGARGGLLDGKSDSLMIAHYAAIKYLKG